jgi:tetratricopeptide (TPR) repeat protein
MQSRSLRLALVAVLVTGAAAACGKYSISNIRSLKAFSDGNNLYKKNDYKGAIARYEDAVRLNPDQELVYFFLGHANDMMYKVARKGEPENDAYLHKAVENYRLAIDHLADSTEPRAAEVRKLAYEYLIAAYGPDKLDDFDKAEPIAKQLMSMEPDEPQHRQMLGRLLEDQGRYEEAEAEFLRAIEMKPTAGAGYVALADFYNRQGQFEKTMEAWQKRAEAEPNNPEAWQMIAHYYWEKSFKDKTLPVAKVKEYTDKGLVAVDKALALNSEYFQAVAFKNILLKQKAKFEKDPKVYDALMKESNIYEQKANEMAKQQNMQAGGGDGKGGGKGK